MTTNRFLNHDSPRLNRVNFTSRKSLIVLILAIALSLACSRSSESDSNNKEPEITRFYTYSVINEYPHDNAAYTQGLVYVDGVLYEGTGSYEQSSLRRVDLETGAVLQSRSLPSKNAGFYFGEGIDVLGEKIFQLTWLSRVGFVYDRITFDSLDYFGYNTQGWGLTHDSSQFIMSDGSSILYFRDTSTFAISRTIQVHDSIRSIGNLNELEYINGEIYANVYQTDRIVRISPSTGFVTGWINLAGIIEWYSGIGVLNGIAYDSENDRLFVTGKNWPKLFEIELVEQQ
ncbi:MAG: glutaminyl-peptide cyclotransferase [Candidatus Zixiibacteriota bacterium]|nr:MAG: glutaminyl-peptide cyclotransferase [candidate division Zixibacteria bacterium]